MCDFYTTFPPVFDENWISDCEAIAQAGDGRVPDIDEYNGKEFGYPAVLDSDLIQRMERHLQEKGNSLASRFAVLRFLYWNVNAALNDEFGDTDEAKNCLLRFLSGLDPSQILTLPHAQWELNQARGFPDLERVLRLCRKCTDLAGGCEDDFNLLKGRVLWCRGTASPVPRQFIDGDPRFVSLLVLQPPEPDTIPKRRDLVIDAKASLEKVGTNELGGHWGVLAHCAAATGDPGSAAAIYQNHYKEILRPFFPPETGEVTLGIPQEVQLHIADLWEKAGRPEKVKATLESIVAVKPGVQGVNRRLAEIHAREADWRRAYEYLRAEADSDEAFGDDPFVSLALQLGVVYEEREGYQQQAIPNFESRPENKSRLAAIGNSLRLFWPPIHKMSEKVSEEWIEGVFWSCDDLEWNANSRAKNSITLCARAFESHLRETIFEPLRQEVTEADIGELPEDRFGPLRLFLQRKKPIELGPMLDSIRCCQKNFTAFGKLSKILQGRSRNPDRLRSDEWRPLLDIRNPVTHESRTVAAPDHPKKLISLCRDFILLLEDPPITSLAEPAAKRPVPGRPANLFP